MAEQKAIEAEEDDEEFDVPRCRICGCTDEEACEGGCVWVPDPEANRRPVQRVC